MGGWDVACALCAGLAGAPYWQDDPDGEGGYDPSLITHQETEWMRDIRILGEDRLSTSSSSRAFLRGPTTGGDYGTFDVGQDYYRVYQLDDEKPIAFPVHLACYEEFCKAAAPEPVDLDLLYETFKALCRGKLPVCLDLDEYGPIRNYLDQYWFAKRGAEEFVTSPSSSSELVDWYRSLATPLSEKGPAQGFSTGGRPGTEMAADPFDKLHDDLLRCVLAHLDMPDASRWRAASRPAAHLVLGNSFWRRKLGLDMPWFYDLPDFEAEGTEIDWEALYKTLFRASFSAGSGKLYNKLANRRRIWKVLCSGILPLYYPRKEEKDRAGMDQVPALVDALSTPLPRLTLPNPQDTSSRTVILIETLDRLTETTPTLVISWTAEGTLADINVHRNGVPPNPVGGLEGQNTEDKVELMEDSWLVGLVLTTREGNGKDNEDHVSRTIVGIKLLFTRGGPRQLGQAEGDHRVVLVGADHLVVGFTVATAADGTLARLALLQQPVSKAPQPARHRITSDDAASDERALSESATQYLWKGRDYPPPSCDVFTPRHGYWSFDIKPDLCPMEALVFGSSDEELSSITALSADTQLGGFEVRYDDGSVRSIGPRSYAMQTMAVDGRGGERIVRVYLAVGPIPTALRFVTNRGRQLVVGRPGDPETRFPGGVSQGAGEHEPSEDAVLLGIYCYWLDRASPKSRLDSAGAFSRPLEHPDHRIPAPPPARDVNGYYWQREAPPVSVVERGPIYAQREARAMMGRVIAIPGHGCLVGWLDCIRPVARLHVTLCHKTRSPQLTLCALSLEYADDSGGSSSVGLDSLRPPQEQDSCGGAEDGHPWCWCVYGSTPKGERERCPHYVRETWEVGRSRLTAFRLWLDEEKRLIGVQFSAADGAESSLWGSSEEGSRTEIKFSQQGGQGGDDNDGREGAVGLKLFLGRDQRGVTYEDNIVVAVQSMVRKVD